MIGPVLRQELLLGTRRHRLHVYRWVFAGYLVILVFFFYIQYWFLIEEKRRTALWSSPDVVAWNKLSAARIVGDWFSEWFLGRVTFPWVLFSPPVFLLIATPPFVAGAIADEKR